MRAEGIGEEQAVKYCKLLEDNAIDEHVCQCVSRVTCTCFFQLNIVDNYNIMQVYGRVSDSILESIGISLVGHRLKVLKVLQGKWYM